MRTLLRSMGRAFGGVAIAAALLASASCMHEPLAGDTAEPEPASPVVEYVTRQEILTPLPLRVRLPARTGADRVLVFFRTWGSRDWDVLELGRAGQTWSGAISCREVSTVTGDTRYFFVALDGEGNEVAGSGWPEWPHVATIVGSLPEGPQSLPGLAALMRCHDPADCPPDFPGCPAYAVRRPSCRGNEECASGRCEWDGYCDVPSKAIADAEPGDDDDDERLEAAVRAATHRSRTASAGGRLHH
jgi:hypothetical protein